jgi:hypothetical protein
MTFKTFLPMGGNPPDVMVQGGNANTNQAPTVILFPPSQQFPENLLASEPLPLHFTNFSLIVIILSPVSLSNSFALVSPMRYTTSHLH